MGMWGGKKWNPWEVPRDRTKAFQGHVSIVIKFRSNKYCAHGDFILWFHICRFNQQYTEYIFQIIVSVLREHRLLSHYALTNTMTATSITSTSQSIVSNGEPIPAVGGQKQVRWSNTPVYVIGCSWILISTEILGTAPQILQHDFSHDTHSAVPCLPGCSLRQWTWACLIINRTQWKQRWSMVRIRSFFLRL